MIPVLDPRGICRRICPVWQMGQLDQAHPQEASEDVTLHENVSPVMPEHAHSPSVEAGSTVDAGSAHLPTLPHPRTRFLSQKIL
jgi:hypothetical protein